MNEDLNKNLLEDEEDLSEDIQNPTMEPLHKILYSIEVLRDMHATALTKGLSKQDIQTVNEICYATEEFGVDVKEFKTIESYLFSDKRSFSNREYATENFKERIVKFIKTAIRKLIEYTTKVVQWIKRFMISDLQTKNNLIRALAFNEVMDEGYEKLSKVASLDRWRKIDAEFKMKAFEIEQQFGGKPLTIYGSAVLGLKHGTKNFQDGLNLFKDELEVFVDNVKALSTTGLIDVAVFTKLETDFFKWSEFNSGELYPKELLRTLDSRNDYPEIYKEIAPQEQILKFYHDIKNELVKLDKTIKVDSDDPRVTEVLTVLGSKLEAIYEVYKKFVQFNKDKLDYQKKLYSTKKDVYLTLFNEVLKENQSESQKDKVQVIQNWIETKLRETVTGGR